MAHTLLKFIVPEMSQNLVPTFQSLDQLNASTDGIADVGYLPRANKFHKHDSFTRYLFLAELHVAEILHSKAFALKSN